MTWHVFDQELGRFEFQAIGRMAAVIFQHAFKTFSIASRLFQSLFQGRRMTGCKEKSQQEAISEKESKIHDKKLIFNAKKKDQY